MLLQTKETGESTTRESVLCLPSADHGQHHSMRTTHCSWPEAMLLPALLKWRGRTQGCFIRSSERWGLGYWITDLLKSEQRDFPGHPGIKMLPSKLGCLGQSLVGEQRSHVLPGNKTQATEPTCSCCNAVKLLHDATKTWPSQISKSVFQKMHKNIISMGLIRKSLIVGQRGKGSRELH